MTQTQHTRPPYLRLWAAAGLGVISIAVSVLLMATDAITGSSHWAHHPGISAAPLLLVAGAIAAGTLARPPERGWRLMPVIAALAFTAWGLAQLFPNSAAAGYLNDAAILLFVTDAAYAVATSARKAAPARTHPAVLHQNPPTPGTPRNPRTKAELPEA